MLPISLQFRFYLTALDTRMIALSNSPFPIPGRRAFPALFPLPVDAAQVDGRLTVALSLGLKLTWMSSPFRS